MPRKKKDEVIEEELDDETEDDEIEDILDRLRSQPGIERYHWKVFRSRRVEGDGGVRYLKEEPVGTLPSGTSNLLQGCQALNDDNQPGRFRCVLYSANGRRKKIDGEYVQVDMFVPAMKVEIKEPDNATIGSWEDRDADEDILEIERETKLTDKRFKLERARARLRRFKEEGEEVIGKKHGDAPDWVTQAILSAKEEGERATKRMELYAQEQQRALERHLSAMERQQERQQEFLEKFLLAQESKKSSGFDDIANSPLAIKLVEKLLAPKKEPTLLELAETLKNLAPKDENKEYLLRVIEDRKEEMQELMRAMRENKNSGGGVDIQMEMVRKFMDMAFGTMGEFVKRASDVQPARSEGAEKFRMGKELMEQFGETLSSVITAARSGHQVPSPIPRRQLPPPRPQGPTQQPHQQQPQQQQENQEGSNDMKRIVADILKALPRLIADAQKGISVESTTQFLCGSHPLAYNAIGQVSVAGLVGNLGAIRNVVQGADRTNVETMMGIIKTQQGAAWAKALIDCIQGDFSNLPTESGSAGAGDLYEGAV